MILNLKLGKNWKSKKWWWETAVGKIIVLKNLEGVRVAKW